MRHLYGAALMLPEADAERSQPAGDEIGIVGADILSPKLRLVRVNCFQVGRQSRCHRTQSSRQKWPEIYLVQATIDRSTPLAIALKKNGVAHVLSSKVVIPRALRHRANARHVLDFERQRARAFHEYCTAFSQ